MYKAVTYNSIRKADFEAIDLAIEVLKLLNRLNIEEGYQDFFFFVRVEGNEVSGCQDDNSRLFFLHIVQQSQIS